MRTFEEDLKMAVAFHGHVCGGQILGTRLARLALQHFGIEEPENYKDLIAFVEADRCLADAVCCVAKCNIGRRRLHCYDYGKMAASFYDIKTDSAIRINVATEASPSPDEDPIAFFAKIPDSEMFTIRPVKIELTPYDLPGKPLAHVNCSVCGERVMDNRHIERDGKIFCKTCAGEPTYYK